MTRPSLADAHHAAKGKPRLRRVMTAIFGTLAVLTIIGGVANIALAGRFETTVPATARWGVVDAPQAAPQWLHARPGQIQPGARA